MRDLGVSVGVSFLLALAKAAEVALWLVGRLFVVPLGWLAIRAAAAAVRLSVLHTQAWLDKREAERLERLKENF